MDLRVTLTLTHWVAVYFIIPSCQWYDLVLFCLINKQVIKYDHNMQLIDINSILRPVNEWCAPSNASIYYMLLSHMQTLWHVKHKKNQSCKDIC